MEELHLIERAIEIVCDAAVRISGPVSAGDRRG
jgi:hypothetical protein